MLFGLFGPTAEITVQFDEKYDTYRRVLSHSTAREVEALEVCPTVQDKCDLCGKVILRLRNGTGLEHGGISVTLVGAMERRGLPPEEFVTTKLALAPPGIINNEVSLWDFDFGAARFPHPSYDGIGISLRYFLRVLVQRKLSDIIKEVTLWCPPKSEIATMAPITTPTSSVGNLENEPLQMDVGLEEFLHIKMSIDQSQYLPIPIAFGSCF